MTQPGASHSVLVLSDLPHSALASLAASIESLGFDRLWYSDARFYHEPYVELTVAALATTAIQLGPAVADPKTRHPALIAMAINSLNELSGGRAVLAVGAGSSGFRNLGLSRAGSVSAMREAIEIITSLLAGETVTLHGESVFIDRARMLVPTQPVPLWVAADGPHTLRLAGAVGDSVLIPHCGSLELLAHKMRYVEEGAERANRDRLPNVAIRIDVSIGEDRDAAIHAGKRALARMLWRHYPQFPSLEALGMALPAALRSQLEGAGPYVYSFDATMYEPFVASIPDELLRPLALAGDPRDVATQVSELVAGGVSEICALPVPPDGSSAEESLRLYGTAMGLAG